MDWVFGTYSDVVARLVAYYEAMYPKQDGDSDFVWRSTIRAKACDDARGLLPASTTSNVGIYLHSLKEKFEGSIVVDLLCYLRLHTELSIRAKGLLMMREQGFMDKAGEETQAKLEELKFLESSIGTTGLLAMKPFMRMSQKDLWQFYMLAN